MSQSIKIKQNSFYTNIAYVTKYDEFFKSCLASNLLTRVNLAHTILSLEIFNVKVKNNKVGIDFPRVNIHSFSLLFCVSNKKYKCYECYTWSFTTYDKLSTTPILHRYSVSTWTPFCLLYSSKFIK